MQDIIGRKSERKELDRLYESGRPEFVAVYGRRRVGKTFLVRTAISPADFQGKKKDLKREQLRAFCSSIQQFGGDWDEMPNDWFGAFACLREMLEQRDETGRKVVFIDELPWMDSGRSGFVSALEHFWNGWGAGRTDLMLIVCGSAASWMNDKIINNTGGLYGRLTYEMHLSPFNLAECERFYESRGISMDRYDQLQSYMVFGGIPYYLNYLKPLPKTLGCKKSLSGSMILCTPIPRNTLKSCGCWPPNAAVSRERKSQNGLRLPIMDGFPKCCSRWRKAISLLLTLIMAAVRGMSITNWRTGFRCSIWLSSTGRNSLVKAFGQKTSARPN